MLAHEVHGNGLPLILIHGFPLRGAMWRAQAQALAHEARVIVPDLPGHGRSRVDHAANIESMAADVAGLVEGRFAVAGFSMGGYVALALARHAPRRIAGLALVDTRADADTTEARAARADTIRAVEYRGMEALADAMVPKLLAPLTRKQRPGLEATVREMILTNPPVGAMQALAAMRDRHDQRDLLPTLTEPALVVVGQDDVITPPAAAKDMAGRLPDAELVLVPDAGHLVPMEQPEACTEALRAWLRRIE